MGEQVRVVGLAVRREVALAGLSLVVLVAAAVAATLIPSIQLAVDGEPQERLNPEDLGYLAVMLGVVFPLIVWKGEAFWRDTPVWTLPVARARHALTKVAAGWVWLMGLVAAGLAAVITVVLVWDGALGIEGTRWVIATPGAAGDPTVPMAWSTPFWQWVMPFTAATATYLLASTLLLATEHPWRWVAGLWVLAVVGMALSEADNLPRAQALAHTVAVSWPDLAASGGTEALRDRVELASGERVWAWRTLPSLGLWATATALWFAVGLGGVYLAARRHRE